MKVDKYDRTREQRGLIVGGLEMDVLGFSFIASALLRVKPE
jgi:hypothetical protein